MMVNPLNGSAIESALNTNMLMTIVMTATYQLLEILLIVQAIK